MILQKQCGAGLNGFLERLSLFKIDCFDFAAVFAMPLLPLSDAFSAGINPQQRRKAAHRGKICPPAH
jgi:hypothetical protein